MLYRVDYVVLLLVCGVLLGFLFSKPLARIATAGRLALAYYAFVAIVGSIWVLAIASVRISHPSAIAMTLYGLENDLLKVSFGFSLGLAGRREDWRAYLTDRWLIDAYILTLVFTFSVSGSLNALSLPPMVTFFAQSGYSAAFLRFIVLGEVFGAIGLLLPWARFIACIGLTTDMFGAVLTHVHNGDPINDSTGAIAALLRLAVLWFLLFLGSRGVHPHSKVSGAMLKVACVLTLCFALAVAGSITVRHYTRSAIAGSTTGH